MLDIKFIKENSDLIKHAVEKKHLSFDVDAFLKIDSKRVSMLEEVETLRARQNKATEEIPNADQERRNALLSEMQVLKLELGQKEDELKEVMKEWQLLMLQVPNVPDMSVPEGVSDEENLEVFVWGEKPKFDFEAKSHIELMENLNLADFERGTKVSGFRGYFLKNEGALLEFALWQYFMEKLVKKGYSPMIVPSLVNRETLFGTGYLPQGEDDLYKTQDGDYLAGTGEVATMSYFSGEIIDKKDLPIKMIAFSPCFRREAGSHGKDVKGLYRVHEFFKLEQVILCEASHEESVKLHEELAENVKELLQELNLPYHVVVNCGGDLGLGQVKKYDIEVWRPSVEKYGETHSCSYFHDFQTRRLNIRYRDEQGKMRYVHSLNNTLVATPRILISILENYQQADGSIKIPEVLRPYMMNKEVISKK